MEEGHIDEPKYHKEEAGVIGVLAGSLSDLSVIDFSPWGFQCFHINSPELKKYVEDRSDAYSDNWETIYKQSRNEIYASQQIFWDQDNLNVLVPLDLYKLPTDQDVFDCHLALLVLFPSEITVRNLHYLQVFDNKIIHATSTATYEFSLHWKHEEPYDHYLKIDKYQIEEINIFMKLFKERAGTTNYISTALKFYLMGWRVNDLEMAFVSLCIALEGIVPGKEQVTFRFKRNLAVLLGENEELAKMIYSNAAKLYDVRSSIVHSSISESTYKHFEQYLDYVKSLSSRMIIEMILHNIETIKTLDEKLTRLGYGSKKHISEKYKPLICNIITYDKIGSVKLP